ncbi:hypothetical protein IKG05_02165, partial [Candidatus Saccharibacteria bacterium]|nr:hypothetical protein [Candidatus Saccharibacteria bacterium]
NPMSLAESYAYFNKTMYKGYYTIQDMTPGICATTDEGSELQVIDVRDEEVYLIGKLKDGRCWLKDNLRLNIADTDVQANLTAETTNATDEALGCLINGGCSSPYSSAPVTDGDVRTFYKPTIMTAYKNSTATHYGNGSGEIGVYYNFCAASAASYCYTYQHGVGNAYHDICPTKWRLPIGDDYQVLFNMYNDQMASSIMSVQYNLSITLTGNYFENELNQLDVNGRYWSSTYFNDSKVYTLQIGKDYVTPMSYTLHRDGGLPIRCIANN